MPPILRQGCFSCRYLLLFLSLPFPWLDLPHPLFYRQPQSTCLFLALGYLSILWSSCFLCLDPPFSCGLGQLLLPIDCDLSYLSVISFLKGSITLLVLSFHNLGTRAFPRHPGCCLLCPCVTNQAMLCLRVLSGSGCFSLSPFPPCSSTHHWGQDWPQESLHPLPLFLRPSPSSLLILIQSQPFPPCHSP